MDTSRKHTMNQHVPCFKIRNRSPNEDALGKDSHGHLSFAIAWSDLKHFPFAWLTLEGEQTIKF